MMIEDKDDDDGDDDDNDDDGTANAVYMSMRADIYFTDV